jgi:hypothetical protein
MQKIVQRVKDSGRIAAVSFSVFNCHYPCYLLAEVRSERHARSGKKKKTCQHYKKSCRTVEREKAKKKKRPLPGREPGTSPRYISL